ncbi:hypothetical protein JXA88_12860 [Candidatus Fermentibacteria bacterium]|nr:hypothetical protein [Candidatus Fermentibacteria bacterium]
MLIIAGIILNQWTLGTLLSPDGVIGARSLRARRPLLAVHLKNREADRCARTQAAVDSAPGGWAERHGKW